MFTVLKYKRFFENVDVSKIEIQTSVSELKIYQPV